MQANLGTFKTCLNHTISFNYTFFNTIIGFIARVMKQEMKNKTHMTRKKKISVCLEMSTLDRKYKRENKFLIPISFYGKIVSYSVNIQKSITILCNNQEHGNLEKENAIRLTFAALRTEAKHAWSLNDRNNKTQMKKNLYKQSQQNSSRLFSLRQQTDCDVYMVTQQI